MATLYYCKNEKRRQRVRDSKNLTDPARQVNGIDYLEVAGVDNQTTLYIHFFHPLPGQSEAVPATEFDFAAANVAIAGGIRIRHIQVTQVAVTDSHVLQVTVDQPGDFSTYTLRLLNLPEGFDPKLSEVDFSFKVECPSDFDCHQVPVCPPEFLPSPQIDYLAKDYASFRRLMLDRLAITLPDWQARSPADLGIALVEMLAYSADYLSYYQDAVATEAYLGTARRRESIRRHARLLNYRLHEGCNARTWIHIHTEAAHILLERGTPFLSQLPGQPVRLRPGSTELATALAQRPEVFETLQDVMLMPAHNEIAFHTWGDDQCCLPKGATQATLRESATNALILEPGEVLILEQRQPLTSAQMADSTLRHPVRLTRVLSGEDRLEGVRVLEIEWHEEDALPFPLVISAAIDGRLEENLAIALGNIVLADHGGTTTERLEPVPAQGRYRPKLPQTGLTYATGYTPPGPEQPASDDLIQDPRAAVPAVRLSDNGVTWQAQQDLLNSGRFTPDFAVEVTENRQAMLRFGDGVYGRRPAAGTQFLARYRVGNGRRGNIGADAIAHLVTPYAGITAVHNPLPAQGGQDPEPVQQARRDAPYAFRQQQRAVTPADYVEVTERHPQVQKAAATRRWTGSWYTVFITVDRKGGRSIDPAFEQNLRQFLDRYRLAGHDIEIDGPQFVALDIAMRVCVAPDYFRSTVEQTLLTLLSSQRLPDGRRGFFHPDNFTFGQSVYLSQMVATATQVPGVQWVQVEKFQRWGRSANGELDAGEIPFGQLEIARLDNDPNVPENGRLEFRMEGGK